MRIKTLTPIHIGSGEVERTFSYGYNRNNDTFSRYDIADLFLEISSERILDNSFLSRISKQKTNETFNSLFSGVNFSKVKPLYLLANDIYNYNDTKFEGEVYLQIKSLNRPYIPGSSIKGTIMTAIIYDYSKKNFDALLNCVNQNKTNINNLDFKKIVESIVSYRNQPLAKEEKDVLNQFASCIECEDVYFDSVSLTQATRIGTGSKNIGTMNLGYRECISANQEAECELFRVNEVKKEMLLRELANRNNASQQLNRFITEYLNKEKIIDILSVYTKAMIQEEYESFVMREESALLEMVKRIEKKKNILRIGNSTNYWFKSISKLVKDANPKYYHENFMSVFGKNKRKARSNSMPKTRVIFGGVNEDYLAGFIEIL